MKKMLIVNIIIVIIMLFSSNVYATTINNSKWNLQFDNIEITSGSVDAIQEPTIIGNTNSEITYSVNLSTPGEFYEFTVDVVNSGSIDALVDEIDGTEITDVQKRYLKYEVTHMDGTKVQPNDRLRAGTTEKLKIRLEFRTDITADDLPEEDTTLTLSLNAYYVQADTNDVEKQNDTSNADNKNSDEEDNKNNIVSNTIENAKTGDAIITYVIILVLALVALLLTKMKSNKEHE